jgi:hypothetical protein
MKRSVLAAGILLTIAAAFMWAQYRIVPDGVRFDVRSVFPREVSPGKYEQVDQRALQALADQGWELVSVTPYVYRNEEHGPELQGPKPVVTQTYPAYFFKRVRVPGRRD